MSTKSIVCTRYRCTREAAVRFGRLGLFLLITVVGLGFGRADAATMKFRAVRVNHVPITPTANPVVVPGDVIEVDLLASGWGTELNRLEVYQASVDNGSLLTGGNAGSVLPLRFNAAETDPANTVALRKTGFFINAVPYRGVCSAGSEDPGASCVSNGADCLTGTCLDSVCIGGLHSSQACAEPENQCPGGDCVTRPDWVFATVPGTVITAVDVSSAYRLGGTPLVISSGPVDPSACVGGSNDGGPCDGAVDCAGGSCHVVDFYLGTLILVASDDAEGEFVLNYLPEPDSFLYEFSTDIDASLRLEPLTITVRAPEPPPDDGTGFEPIPTVSTWGMAALALMLMIAAKLHVRRRRWHRLA